MLKTSSPLCDLSSNLSTLKLFIPGKLTFCNYKLFTWQLWSNRCAGAMTHAGYELRPILYKYSFISIHFFRVAIGAGANPKTHWGECTKKTYLKIVLTTKLTQTDQSYSWNIRMKRVFMQEKILMLGCRNMFSQGNLDNFPQGMKMRAEKQTQSKIKGGIKAKKKLVNHLGVQSFDSTGQLLWDQCELEFTLGSRQSHGYIGYGMTGICFSPCGLPSPGDWKWFGRVAGLPLVK